MLTQRAEPRNLLRKNRVPMASFLPMDYADSTLVALAEEISTTRVLTTDRRDFGVHRLRGGEPFEILP